MTTKRTNNTIEWPSSGHFTINDLIAKYPDMVEITLRFRVNKALKDNEISVIGKVKPAIGRPRLVFVKGAVTPALSEAALKAGILPIDSTASVGVAEVKSSPKPTKALQPVSPALERAVSQTVKA